MNAWWNSKPELISGPIPWTFPLYFFLAIYATLLYLICSLVFPDEIDEYDGFRNYFYYRRKWIFDFMIALFALDFIDTAIKGPAYRAQAGRMANFRDALYIAFCLSGIQIKHRAFQASLACLAVLYEIFYILTRYLTLR